MFDPIPGVADQGVVFEDEEKVVIRDCWGAENERPKASQGQATGAYHLAKGALETPEEWLKLKSHFDPEEPLRYPSHWDGSRPALYLPWPTQGPQPYDRIYPKSWEERVAEWKARESILTVEGPSMFGQIKEEMGFEAYCMAICDRRDMIEDVMETRTRLAETVLDRIYDQTQFDVLHFWEDIAYNSGPLLGPDVIRDLGAARYKRLVDAFRSRGGKVVTLDSDGNIWSLIPVWLEAGVNCLWPMEVNAGMDVAEVRRQYGKDLAMMGGINKYALMKDKDAIDRELDRVAPVVQGGGYIPMLDHGVPPGIPFENYCYYMERKRELLGCP
jgi:uroporphyrinogen decarboxylase